MLHIVPMSAALQGHALSEETKRKISESRKGQKRAAETRAKMSAAKSTPEARAANSARMKAWWTAKRVAEAQHG